MGSPKKEGSLTVELLTRFKNKRKKKVPDQRTEENKRKERRKIPIKDWKKAKKERKTLDQRSEENKIYRKGLWTRQYLNNTELSQVNK